MSRLKSATGVDVAPARIIDMTLTGTQYDAMKAALGVLTSAPEFDLVVAVIGSSARFYPDLAMKPLLDSAGIAKPIAAFQVPEAPAALKRLSEAGVPSFHTPEACADAIAVALGRREPRPIEARDRSDQGGSESRSSMSWKAMRYSKSSACRTRRVRA